MSHYSTIYSALSNEELLALAAEQNDLVEQSCDALLTELRKRGLEQEATQACRRNVSEQQTRAEELITIATINHPTTAQLARSRLESEGIDCVLTDEHMVRMYSWASRALGGIKLQVKVSDVSQAESILRPHVANMESSWISPTPRARRSIRIILLWFLAAFLIGVVLFFNLYK